MESNLELKNKVVFDEKLRWVEIYKIKNKINNKVYVGQTVSHRKNDQNYYPNGMECRFKQHIKEAYPKTITKYHCNSLNNAIRKYGVENFDLELICNCKVEESDKIETEEIIKNNSIVPNGYNITPSYKSLVLPSKVFRNKISKGNIIYHENRHIKKFENVENIDIDENNIEKYITPRIKNKIQIGWYVRINKKVIEFKSAIEPLEQTKERAINFIKKIKEVLNGNVTKLRETTLEPSLPLTHGNICEELG
jgi:hypothetical protein